MGHLCAGVGPPVVSWMCTRVVMGDRGSIIRPRLPAVLPYSKEIPASLEQEQPLDLEPMGIYCGGSLG